MKLNSAPLRFVVGVLGLWVGARAVSVALPAPASASASWESRHRMPGAPPRRTSKVPHLAHAAPAPPMRVVPAVSPRSDTPLLLAWRPASTRALATKSGRQPRPADAFADTLRGWSLLPAAARTRAPRARQLPLPGPISTAEPKRWSGTAYIFLRQDGGAPGLASGGQLGGSQLFARIAYQLPGAVAVAARVYSPLETLDGAEAGLGADLHVLRGKAPLRISVERRFALGDEARSAWSAYAAGGFYTAAPLGLEADGYAQAGVVGAKRRDLFADGALRLSYPVTLGGKARAGIGVGAWGAAQPGVERLDIGPRASLSLPVADRSLVVNLDMRLRVAGEARPGSGVALTIGSDF